MMKMNLSPRNVLIVTAAGVLLALVLVAILLVYPRFGTLDGLRSQVDDELKKESQARTLLEQRVAVKDRAVGTDAAYLQLLQSVPENSELPSLIIELQDVALANDVELRGLIPGDLAVVGSYVEIPIEVTIWGDWNDAIEFMNGVSELSRYVRIVNVNAILLTQTEIEPAKKAGDEVPLDFGVFPTKTIVRLKAFAIAESALSGAGAGAAAAPAPPQ